MPYTDRQIRDHYITVQQEFWREADEDTLIKYTAARLEIDLERVRRRSGATERRAMSWTSRTRTTEMPRVIESHSQYQPEPRDAEVSAILAVVEALEPLDERQRARVLDYVRARYGYRYQE